MTRRNHRTRAGALGLGLALAASLVVPSIAQEAAPTLPGDAAVARLDFPAALEELGAAIEADPAAPAPRLARAALHVKMQRPALALADLDAVLAVDPAHLPALRARVEIWDAQRAWNRARADLDAALAAAPGDAQVLALRAWVNDRAGMTAAAQADYDAARAAAPDDADLAREGDALVAAQAERTAARVQFGPEAVPSDDFRVEIGDAAAPNTLHIVHAATDLAPEVAAVDTALFDRAVDDGALRIVHLFTYTGEDASIWGNLALICAGPDGFAATHAALSDTPGRAALDAAGTGDFAPLERLLNAAYSVAGIDEGLVRSCALDRMSATRYLADWQAHRDAGAWRGINLLDTWPVWVLNGTSVGPQELAAKLAAIAPAPEIPAAPEIAVAPGPEAAGADTPPRPPAPSGNAAPADAPQPAAPAPVASAPTAEVGQNAAPAPVADGDPVTAANAPEPSEQNDDASVETAGPPPATGEAPPEAVADAGPDDAPANTATEGATPAPVAFPKRPDPVTGARVPVELRGIYAPTLAACLNYLETIEDPSRIDAVLPDMNPLDGPALGTILVTSRRVYLFNPLDTECAIAGADTGADGDWQGSFACASPLAPAAAPQMQLARAPADGSAPLISASFGTAAPVVLRQCRALGQLGNAFAPLWAQGGTACTVAVPVEQGKFTFSVDADGNLVLRIAPASIPAEAGRTLLHAVIDGASWNETSGRWDGTGWQKSLGSFDAAAERLGWGMFLDVRATGAAFEARLPLFGSSAAMDTLAACAPASD